MNTDNELFDPKDPLSIRILETIQDGFHNLKNVPDPVKPSFVSLVMDVACQVARGNSERDGNSDILIQLKKYCDDHPHSKTKENK